MRSDSHRSLGRLVGQGILVLGLLFGTAHLLATHSFAQEVLTNDSVTLMTWSQLPEAVIVAKIWSTESRFDLRAEALIALKKAGVADRVLEAMMGRSAAAAQAAPPPSAPGSTVPGAAQIPAGPIPPGMARQGVAGTLPPASPPADVSAAFQSPVAPGVPLPAPGAMPAPMLPPMPGAIPEGAGPGAPPVPPMALQGMGAAPPGAADGQDHAAALVAAVKGIAEVVRDLTAKGNQGAAAPPPAENPGPGMGAPPAAWAPPAGTPDPAAGAAAPAAPVAPLAPPLPAMAPATPVAEPAPPAGAGGRGEPGGPGAAPRPTGADAWRQGRLGVEVVAITPELAREVGRPDLHGFYIRNVLAGGPAEAGGLRAGDFITHVNGQIIRTHDELDAALRHRRQGTATQLGVVRDGRRLAPTVPGSPGTGAGVSPTPTPSAAPAGPTPRAGGGVSVAGRYRCWSQNVGGAGGRCTSPPLVLHPDGTYQMSGERGTYAVQGDRIVLSESKMRGPGTFQDGNRIVFEYTYRGQAHTVTYLRQGEAPAAAPARPEPPTAAPAAVPVEITLRFAPNDGSVGWINAAALIPEGGREGPEALARTDGKQTVAASFRAVPAGRTYTLMISSGFERRAVGTVDLRDATGPVALTVNVPAPPQDRDRLSRPQSDGGYAAPRAGGGDAAPLRAAPAAAPAAPAPKAAPAPAAAPPAAPPGDPPCNPSIPRYAQPGCQG